MNRQQALPRVTYSNIRADFSGVHAELDRRIGEFERTQLGHLRPNRIGGRDDTRGETYAVASPIDADLALGTLVGADGAAVDAAVAAAAAAFPAWSAESAGARVAVLRAVADELERRKWDLAIAALLEVGKSRMEALGEAEEAIDMVRYYAAEAETHGGWQARPLQRAFPQEETSDRLRPYGVFGVIAPFNYPIALSVGMLTGAILTGNTAVLKPSAGMGLTARLLVEACEAGGVPAGVVNLVCGGADTGRALLQHPGVAGFVFTGSHRTGMEILRHCASGRWHRPVIVEMGGKNPAYVTATADLDVAAEGVTRSAFGLSGQKCSALSRLFVHAAVHDVLLDRIAARSRALAVGDPRRAGIFTGPVIDARAGQRFADAVAEARAAGGTVVCGGERARRRHPRPRRLCRADHRRRPRARSPPQPGGAVRAAAGRAPLRRSRRRAARGQRGRLRAHRGNLRVGRGGARPLSRPRGGGRALRQPRQRRDHRRLARHPELLRVEGLGRVGEGRPGTALPDAVPARAVAHHHDRMTDGGAGDSAAASRSSLASQKRIAIARYIAAAAARSAAACSGSPARACRRARPAWQCAASGRMPSSSASASASWK